MNGISEIQDVKEGTGVCPGKMPGKVFRFAYVDDEGRHIPGTRQTVLYCHSNGHATHEAEEISVMIFDESAGANCPRGGMRFVVGEDDCKGGVVEGSSLTQFVCEPSGAIGGEEVYLISDIVPGIDCPTGGFVVEKGADDGTGKIASGTMKKTGRLCLPESLKTRKPALCSGGRR
jgi:hypothetical protein